MFTDDNLPNFEEYGKAIELHEPYLGYTYGHIVGIDGYRFVVQFSSGLEVSIYSDEFDFV